MEGELARSKAQLPSLLLALLSLWPGILAEVRFKADNEVLQMLAGNSSQTLLERCSELLFGQARAQPQEVNGVLGGTVLLSPALPPNKTVKEIEWSFSDGDGATIQVAEFGPSGFERPDPKDRFKDRLEMFNKLALKIRALERGDSGVYGARIKLQPALVEDQFFNLSIYESVPSPRTRSQLLASTLEWCNLTLQCQGAGKGAVNVTWKKDNIIRDLTSDRHQLSPDGTTLRLALPPTAANVTYACTVSNPADQKVVLFDLQAICQSGGGQTSFSKSGYIVLTLILLAVSLGGAFWCWRMNSEKAADPAATPTAPAEESPSDPQYAEIVRRSPPEGNDQGLSHPENNQEQSPPQKTLVTTVYEQIHRAPEDTAEEVT
uniref:Ig-like domain-containing protein n=1 Tax=Accipiter nisus TaxID=211598 RepID=A0A8B9NPT9_9AVES